MTQPHTRPAWLLSSLFLFGVPATADQVTAYRVIVHPDNPTHHLSITELSDLFLKKEEAWTDGHKVEPVEPTSGSPMRRAFSEDIHGRSVTSIKSYWQQMIFSGKAVPPLEIADEEGIVSFVGSHRGGVGYVSLESPLQGVKVLSVVHPPVRTRYVPPVYPEMARKARKEGIVLLNVEISSDGQVSAVAPLTEVGLGLTREAVRAVRQWQFEPPMSDGQATSATFRLSVDFQLP